LYYEYCSCVELLILILVEMLKIFTFFNKTCGYGYGDDLLPTGGYGVGYGYWFALLDMNLGRQNPWVLYPLTSLLVCFKNMNQALGIKSRTLKRDYD
jgi:hypothetical protein